ncbi:MAG: hypothetical protein WCE79_09935 [Xanthobacteraceae bacterium]
MKRLMIAMAVASVGALGGAWLGVGPGARAATAVWTEMPWPFPMDQWGKGTAFTCRAADCGTQVTVYIRAKIGFCNCSTGVADDEELDRISDFELIGSHATPQGPGRPITVAWMKGRSRPFDAEGAMGAKLSALSVGFNQRCDAVVATAVVAPGRAAEIEPSVLEFLNSRTVLRWTVTALGL